MIHLFYLRHVFICVCIQWLEKQLHIKVGLSVWLKKSVFFLFISLVCADTTTYYKKRLIGLKNLMFRHYFWKIWCIGLYSAFFFCTPGNLFVREQEVVFEGNRTCAFMLLSSYSHPVCCIQTVHLHNCFAFWLVTLLRQLTLSTTPDYRVVMKCL